MRPMKDERPNRRGAKSAERCTDDDQANLGGSADQAKSSIWANLPDHILLIVQRVFGMIYLMTRRPAEKYSRAAAAAEMHY